MTTSSGAAPRPFRFGVQVLQPYGAAEWRELVARVEHLGYSSLLVTDHLASASLAPLVALGVAAGVSSSLRVGTLVLCNDFRHPVVLAKEAATLDVLSGGRAEIGLGAGWAPPDYDALGTGLDPAGVRVARLEEAIAVMKQAWRSEPFDHHGTHYTTRGYQGHPAPCTRPHPTLIIGGGSRRVLELAGREADIVNIGPDMRSGTWGAASASSSSAERTTAKVNWVRAAAGDRFGDIELQVRPLVAAITDEPMVVASAAAASFGMAPDDLLASGLAMVGDVDEVVDQLEERRARWGFSYVVVGDDLHREFAPVVARLAGR